MAAAGLERDSAVNPTDESIVTSREEELERRIRKLEKINAALMNRVERSMAQQGNAYSLFHTAIGLESQVRVRTDALKDALFDLERTNDELMVARDTSDRSNRVKTRFFTAVGHDLLQPLHAARLSLSAMEESGQVSEQVRLAAQIDHALSTIEELLKTILDLSKLEAGVIQPNVKPIALNQLFHSLIVDIEPIARDKGLAVRWRRTLGVVRSDPMMLRQVLQNLLANAVRYTNRGSILLAARRRGDDYRIEVWDTGPGIEAAEQERIFEEFQRGRSASNGAAGFGLGLAIVLRTAQTLGHTIGLCSQVGRGTCFNVSAPATIDRPQEIAPSRSFEKKSAYGFAQANVILIDNDEVVLSAMRTLLERWQCHVETACDLAEVESLLSAADLARPHIVLADFHLDHGACGLDGIKLVREKWGAEIPAVVITADHTESVEAQVLSQACEILRKPVRPAELRALMAHLLS